VAVHRNTVELRSAYYDTPDGDLQTHGVLLRRRDGDDDTGWQLKVPDVEGRVEVRTALSDTPPSELTGAVTGIRLGKPLLNVTISGENGFTYGLLHAREQQSAETARRQVRELVG
jgi:uncharacterized protein YjbK